MNVATSTPAASSMAASPFVPSVSFPWTLAPATKLVPARPTTEAHPAARRPRRGRGEVELGPARVTVRDAAGHPLRLPRGARVGSAGEELLEALLDEEGLQLSVATRQRLSEPHVDLLARLDRAHGVQARVPVPALDPAQVWALDGGPGPRARLAALEALAAAGLDTRLVLTPLVCGCNDDPAALAALFAAAARAGVRDVEPVLPPPRRRRGRGLLALVTGRPGRRENRDAALAMSCRFLRLAHGFPRALPGRG